MVGPARSVALVKRTLMLLALPVALAVVWAVRSTGGDRSAQVDITADHPTDLRTAVIASMSNLGGVRVSEHTSFDGRGSSELTFDVPTAKLEAALGALDGLGGTVTDQQVDLSQATDQAKDVTSRLGDLEGCLSKVSDASSVSSGRSALSTCQSDLSAVTSKMDSATVALDRAQLVVRIHPTGVSNPALIVAVILLLGAAAALGVLMWRSSRSHQDVDLREIGQFDSDDDLHLRRN